MSELFSILFHCQLDCNLKLGNSGHRVYEYFTEIGAEVHQLKAELTKKMYSSSNLYVHLIVAGRFCNSLTLTPEFSNLQAILLSLTCHYA